MRASAAVSSESGEGCVLVEVRGIIMTDFTVPIDSLEGNPKHQLICVHAPEELNGFDGARLEKILRVGATVNENLPIMVARADHNQAGLLSPEPGKLVRVYRKKGDKLKENQHLADIELDRPGSRLPRHVPAILRQFESRLENFRQRSWLEQLFDTMKEKKDRFFAIAGAVFLVGGLTAVGALIGLVTVGGPIPSLIGGVAMLFVTAASLLARYLHRFN